jgi:ABC-type bacteriocin/lantibiotic exporter with double-glycine peptidase domain
LIQLAVFDTVFNVFPHLASLLYLYYAMPDFPSTAVWKTSTVLAILVFDIIVVILSYTLLNIENRRRWNEEQIENEAFTHDYLVEKENDSKQNAVQAKESQQQQDEHQLYDQL